MKPFISTAHQLIYEIVSTDFSGLCVYFRTTVCCMWRLCYCYASQFRTWTSSHWSLKFKKKMWGSRMVQEKSFDPIICRSLIRILMMPKPSILGSPREQNWPVLSEKETYSLTVVNSTQSWADSAFWVCYATLKCYMSCSLKKCGRLASCASSEPLSSLVSGCRVIGDIGHI